MRKLLLPALLLSAPPAWAHEGHHETMPSGVALRHLLQSPDHLLMAAAAVALVLVGGAAWLRRNAR